jgi:hypothetical protein
MAFAESGDMREALPSGQLRISLRKLFLIVAVAGFLSFLLSKLAYLPIYYNHRRAGGEQIDSVARRVSSTLSPAEKEVVDFWMGCAYANVCFSPEHVSLVELKRFNEDVRQKLESNVDLGTTDWIWSRLAETGEHGARYVAKFEPRYHEQLAHASGR